MAEPVLTAADLQALKAEIQRARFAGVKVVEYGGKRTEYKSDREMLAAIAAIDRELAAVTGARPVKTVLVKTSKGV